jgi:hypothetical protein
LHGRFRRVDRRNRLWLLDERFVDRDGPIPHFGNDGYQYYIHGRERDYVRHRGLDERHSCFL